MLEDSGISVVMTRETDTLVYKSKPIITMKIFLKDQELQIKTTLFLYS